jgi:hypothetical protein
MECRVCEQNFPSTEIEEHHVLYSPEVTVNVCIACHNSIHADNGRLEHLNPHSGGVGWVGRKYRLLTEFE